MNTYKKSKMPVMPIHIQCSVPRVPISCICPVPARNNSINPAPKNILPNATTLPYVSSSKILERTNFQAYPDWQNFFNSLMKHIELAIHSLEKDNVKKFRYELRKIRTSINKLTGNFKKHVQDVFRKAEINKASRIYEHGISMEKTSRLLGITIWDLAEYTGQTGISDVNLSITLPVKKRIQIAEEIFEKW